MHRRKLLASYGIALSVAPLSFRGSGASQAASDSEEAVPPKCGCFPALEMVHYFRVNFCVDIVGAEAFDLVLAFPHMAQAVFMMVSRKRIRTEDYQEKKTHSLLCTRIYDNTCVPGTPWSCIWHTSLHWSALLFFPSPG